MTQRPSLTLTARKPRDSLAVAGEIDVDSAPALRTRAPELIRQGRPHLVIDLELVEFCDSSGLNAMIGVLRYAKDRHGPLSLAAAPPHLARLLDITGVGELIPVFPPPAEALTRIAACGVPPAQRRTR